MELARAPAGDAQLVRGDGSGVAPPTKLPNPAALEIYLNGSSKGGYDGTSAKTINITSSSIGLGYVLNEKQFCASNNNIRAIWNGQFEVKEGYLYSTDGMYFSSSEFFNYPIIVFDLGASHHVLFFTRGTGEYINANDGFPSYSGTVLDIMTYSATLYRSTGNFKFSNMYRYSITSGSVTKITYSQTIYGIYGIGRS